MTAKAWRCGPIAPILATGAAGLLRRAVLALALLSGGIPAAAGAQEVTIAEARAFAESMVLDLRKEMDPATLTIDEQDPLVIHVTGHADWEDAYFNLHRIFNFCQNNPVDDCAAIRAEYVENVTYRPDPPTVENLRVIVRDAEYVSYLRQTEGPGGQDYPMRQIGEDLYALLAIDSPRTIAVAPVEQLAELGLTEAQAWEVALAQTRAIVPSLPPPEAVLNEFHAFADMEYLPVLLMPSTEWDAIARVAGPDMFVTAVSDGLVILGVLPDGEDFERMRAVVMEDCQMAGRCLSPNIYRWREGRWVIAGSPAALASKERAKR